MKQFRIILVVFFSLLLLPLNFESDSNLSAAALLQDDAYGKKTIVLDSDAQNTFALGKYIKVLKDKSKKLTSYDVFSGNFEESFQLGRRDIINLGIINANVWIEFPTIINYSDGKQWYIVIDNESVATLRSISFYFLRDDETIHFVEIPNKKHFVNFLLLSFKTLIYLPKANVFCASLSNTMVFFPYASSCNRAAADKFESDSKFKGNNSKLKNTTNMIRNCFIIYDRSVN